MKFIEPFIWLCAAVFILAAAYRIAIVDAQPAVQQPNCIVEQVELLPPCTTDSDCEDKGTFQL